MENNLLKKRDVTIDLIKGLGILFMVAGHAQIPCINFIYLFHMAIFFIASGYLYNSEKSASSIKTVGNFIFRKFKSLWLPFVIWSSLYTICNNLFIKLNIYTDNPLLLKYVNGPYMHTTEYLSLTQTIKLVLKSLFLSNSAQVGSAFWFISVLFKLMIVYCIIDFFVRKLFKEKYNILIQSIISLILLAVGYICSLNNIGFHEVEKVCSYYILITSGRILKKFDISNKLSEKKIINIIIFIISFGILLILSKYVKLALDMNYYINPIFFMFISFIGWEFCFTLSTLIKKVNLLTKTISYWGKNTMPILILHLLSFKLVSLIGILIQGKPLFLMAAFPVLYTDGLWWVAYTIVGMVIPLVLNWLYQKLKLVIVSYIKTKRVA